MAGVIAMASVIEDFEIQPCKKRKKDSDAPGVKTITNYFTPVAKTMEKPFSPPRSSITDYFKKTPPATKVASPPHQSKENELHPVEALAGADHAAKRGKPPSKKPGRKVGRPAKKALVMNPPVADEDDVVVVESTAQSENQPADAPVSVETAEGTGSTASSTQNSGQTVGADEKVYESDCTDDVTANSNQDKILKETSESGVPSVRTDPKQDGAGRLVSSTPEEKGMRGRTVRKNGRGGKADAVQHDAPEVQECSEQRLPSSPSCETGSEANADVESQQNLSTVTVSFADFLKSQSPKVAARKQQEEEEVEEEEEEEEEEEKKKTEAGGTEPTPPPGDQATDRLSVINPFEEGGDQPPTQVSPRTLTVQAEVHPISPDQDLSHASDRKVASIFTACRRTKDKFAASPQPQANSEPHPTPLRRSNVVLQEEDLELAVLEDGSSPSAAAANVPKCSQAERKQFMNAFKRPTPQDTAKGKAGKQKQQPSEKDDLANGDEGEKEEEGKAKVAEVEMVEADPKPVELKGAAPKVAGKRKRGRPKKDQRTIPEEPTPPAAPPAQAEAPPAAEDGDSQPGTDQPTSTPAPASTPTETRRRSPREPTRKQSTPVSLTPSSQSNTNGESEPKHTQSSSKPQGLPSPVSTPKTHRPKQRVYRSHMLVPPDDQGSPIRMKFTRVFPSPGEMSEFEILSPLIKEDSKKRRKAQKLVQKARAFQQSRQAAAEENAPPRRSSRRQDTAKKNYCEPEAAHTDGDSVICLEEGDGSSTVKSEDTKAKKQKKVRSLNDVLGKNTPGTKGTKTLAVTGSKVAPVFLGKKAQRSSAVISIFDDSSHDASGTSLDDEQFRARRDFLKSGLPESFKKQIAKTAASREAYTLSCASFQRVEHVLQRPEGCSLWGLPWPACPRLSCVKEAGAQVDRPAPAAVGPVGLTIVPAHRSCREQSVSGWREDFSEPVRRWLLEEIGTSNPSFPTHRIFAQLLRRRAEHLLKATVPEADGVPQEASGSSCPQPVGGKRKREEEAAAAEKVPKKRRASQKEPETIIIPDNTPEPPRRGRGARGRTRRQQQEGSGEEPKAEVVSTPAVPQKDDVIVLDSPSPSEHTSPEDAAREDVMWTEKYQPQHSSDVIGNMLSIRRLHSWLREWKLRADREERKKQQEKKQEEDCNDSWVSECDETLEEDLLCNTLLISGPTGVGKTAAVYACAQELGFKVFEVNCSSQRSGRQILSQLKEATQSHQVDIQGVNAHKPAFFSSYSGGGGGSGSRPGSSPRKVKSPRRVVSSPHKPPQSPRGGPSKRGSLAPTSLANFFKMGGKAPPKEAAEANAKKPQPVSKSPRKRAKAKESSCKTEDLSGTPAPAPSSSSPAATPPTPASAPPPVGKAPGDEQGKRTATSLILFEEVDVIFDDDSGFLAAIKTFMTTTKRPVILTTSDPSFRTSFDGYLDEIHFETPSVESVSSYLRLLCLAESVRVAAEDVASLLRCNGGDVRRSLLQLQCWIRSGAGAPHTASATESLQASGSGAAADQDGKPDVPPCEASCTASLLGLLNIQPQGNLFDFIKCESASPLCWELLAEAGSRGLDLLYSNMEVLLPLPTRTLKHALPIAHQEPEPDQPVHVPATLPPQPAVPSPNTKPPLLAEMEDEASPLKVSSRMRQKKHLRPDAKDPFQSDSDSDDGFLSLPRPTAALGSSAKELKEEQLLTRPVTERRKKVELTEAERKRSVPVSLALGAMAEFLEHMSALDSSLLHPASRAAEGACVQAAEYGWARAEIRSGLTDEPRLVGGHRAAEEQAREIRAAMESLSFRRCRAGVEQALEAAQALGEEGVRRVALEEITLPVAPHRQAFSITPDSTLCQPGLLQHRCELMRSVCSSRVSPSSRTATALDILPALRAICRSEQLKEQGKVKRRFLHYLEGINLGVPKRTLQLLATDFP